MKSRGVGGRVGGVEGVEGVGRVRGVGGVGTVAGAVLLAVALCVAVADAQAPAPADNRAIARRYFEDILSNGNATAIDAIIADDVIFRNPPVVIKGIAAYRKLVADLRAAFPDLRFTLDDVFGEGNKVATRWVMRGTQGTRKLEVSGMDIFLIENGKIREIWVNMDTLAQAQQMGMIPAK